jgi:hypothetical protein
MEMMLSVFANSWQNKVFLQNIFKFAECNLSSIWTIERKSDGQYDPRTNRPSAQAGFFLYE